MVTDGVVRDVEGIRQVGLPVFAQPGFVSNGGRKNGPGEVNVPIAVGGLPVLPGDILVGDQNGVVVIPRADAEAVLAAARKIAASETAKLAELAAGKLIPDGFEKGLVKKGCELIEAPRQWN
jgi:regulator of RNase E activity RraA